MPAWSGKGLGLGPAGLEQPAGAKNRKKHPLKESYNPISSIKPESAPDRLLIYRIIISSNIYIYWKNWTKKDKLKVNIILMVSLTKQINQNLGQSIIDKMEWLSGNHYVVIIYYSIFSTYRSCNLIVMLKIDRTILKCPNKVFIITK